MNAIPAAVARRSAAKYIRSFLAALPRLRILVRELGRWDRERFDPRKEFDTRRDQIQNQLFAASMAFVQFMMSARSMRRVMDHHCRAHSIAFDSCPPAILISGIDRRSRSSAYRKILEATAEIQPRDYRPAYALALFLEDEGAQADAATQYKAIAAQPRPGAYALMRAARVARDCGESEELYEKAVDLYPDFSLGQRALGKLLRARSPLDAATHYTNALLQGPKLEFGEQSWAMAKHGWVELDVHAGFRIYFAPEERMIVAIPMLLGIPRHGVTVQLLGFSRRFLGLALMRFYKDKIWRRDPHTVSPATAATVVLPAAEPQRRRRFPSVGALLWAVVPLLRRWTVGHYRYFQFVLVGKDIADIRKQIDHINDSWINEESIG